MKRKTCQPTPSAQLFVRNWTKWQSYRKDRGQPPWIKLHRQILRDLEWMQLSDAQRGQLVSLWVLAADNDGQLPTSQNMLQRLCQLESKPDVDAFVALGFLEWRELDDVSTPEERQADAKVTPSRHQHDGPEAEAEAETEKRGTTNKRFIRPTLQEVASEIHAKGYSVEPDCFWNHYESNGWKVGRNAMKSWKAALAKWNADEKKKPASPHRTAESNRAAGLDYIDRMARGDTGEGVTMDGEFNRE